MIDRKRDDAAGDAPHGRDRFLDAMVYAMPDPVACTERGVVVGFNKAACALFLVDESAVVGKALRDVLQCDEKSIKDGARLKSERGDGRILDLTLFVSAAAGSDQPRAIVVFQNGDAPRDPAEDLSPRLREVLGLLTEGKAVKEIAYELKLSQHTVHDYVKALYKRYGVMSRAELLATVLSPRGRPR